MTSRILGLTRDQVLLVVFGSDKMDAFQVAFRLPGLVRDLFAEGAMSAAFVPTFTRELKRDGKPGPGSWGTWSSPASSSSPPSLPSPESCLPVR